MNRIWKATLAGSAVASVASLVAATPAFAVTPASVTTTMTVSTSKATELTGQPITFHAQVAPSASGKTKTTGTVAWTITGIDGSAVTCAKSSAAISKAGTASCKVAAATLQGGDAPYTVTATYSGDGTFLGSTGSLSEAVGPQTSHVSVAFAAPPTSGAASTVIVTVTGGAASALVAGDAVFGVSAVATAPKAVNCDGLKIDNTQVLTNGGMSATASCNLPAGWLVIPTASKSDPKPKAYYSVSAAFAPTSTASFTPVGKTIVGRIK